MLRYHSLWQKAVTRLRSAKPLPAPKASFEAGTIPHQTKSILQAEQRSAEGARNGESVKGKFGKPQTWTVYAVAGFLGWHTFTTYFYSADFCTGVSMMPTIASYGDWVYISKYYRRGRDIVVGDLVSFKNPVTDEEYAIKRVIGLPGDFVLMNTPGKSEAMVQVPDGHCWVTGDNLLYSRDSRMYGPLPMALINGKARHRDRHSTSRTLVLHNSFEQRKEGIPFRIFECDVSTFSRSAGWGLTINWALPTLRSILPEEVLARLPETSVNRNAVHAGDKGNFIFYDLATGTAKWKAPAAERIRVSGERLRLLLLTGVEVEWGKTVGNVVKDDSGVTVFFYDGTSATGSFLIACDGAHSLVRRLIHPTTYENYQLPVRLIGAGVRFPESQVSAIRNLDPYLLQGSDPRTDAYLCFSFLETPGDHGCPEISGQGEMMYYCQVMTSWPYRGGFLGRANPSNVPNTEIGQLSWMQALSADWVEPFRTIVRNIPIDSEIKPVGLTDWVPRRNTDNVFDGRVVLLGDAMHAMVMYRGEGANHAIMDVSILLDALKPLYKALDLQVGKVDKAFRDAVDRYEDEVVARTEIAVLASRQACLDAHDFKRLNDDSPLVRRRLMRADLEDVRR